MKRCIDSICRYIISNCGYYIKPNSRTFWPFSSITLLSTQNSLLFTAGSEYNHILYFKHELQEVETGDNKRGFQINNNHRTNFTRLKHNDS